MEFALLGFLTGLSLILAIGAQNVFVIEQGLKKQHVFLVCFICSISDFILIFLGIFLFHYFTQYFNPTIELLLNILLVIFLIHFIYSKIKSFNAHVTIDQNSNFIKIAKKISLITKKHKVKFIEAKPSFGNIIVWKVIYSTSDKYYVNAIRLSLDHKIYPGESIEKLDVNKSFPWLDANSQQAKDIEKFRWFSNGYLGVDKKNRYVIYDVRFSTIPNQVEGLWGIKLDENKKDSEHVEYVTNRKRDLDRFNILINMVSGTHEN